MNNSYWDYLEHSAKGTTWKKKKHKYLFIKKGRYYYKYDLGEKELINPKYIEDEYDVVKDYMIGEQSDKHLVNEREENHNKNHRIEDSTGLVINLPSETLVKKYKSNKLVDAIIKKASDYTLDDLSQTYPIPNSHKITKSRGSTQTESRHYKTSRLVHPKH